MPPPASAADFVAVVRKSGLVTDDRLNPEVDRLASGPAAPTTPDQMAAALVRAGLLTRFQARQLKLGRYKRFTIAGKYRLLELLGVGGMGAVYLCEHVLMKRLVAVKVLPAESLSDPSNLERFYREARAVAALNDPNVVRAYDIDQSEGLHFLVMEYVDGVSLQEIVARFGPLDPVRAATYTAQAANGLQHAGDLGMVHRDIKPANLLLDRTGVIKILDMGLARFFNDKQDNLTAKYDEKSVLGTADYLAPEQTISSCVDIRADIYALGGTLYFMLTGKSPVPEGTVAQKLVFHQTKTPAPVEATRADVPAGLLTVLRKMMAKDPADRYQAPADVAAALAPWADPALPAPPGYEMPDLCPAVLALSGHAADRVKSGSAGRLSDPGRLIQSRAGGSTARPTAGPDTPPAGGASRVPIGGTPTQAHVETDRGTRTAPLPVPGPGSGGSDAKVALRAPSAAGPVRGNPPSPGRRVPVWLAAGAAAGLLATAGVVVYFASGPRKPPVPPPASTPGAEPAAATAIIPAGDARHHIGEERTVAFTVARVAGDPRAGHLFLTWKADQKDPDNFTAYIPGALARDRQLTATALKKSYEGHEVRVRGVIEGRSAGALIEVTDLAQISPPPVPDR